jgi:hypothetical protein
MEASIMENWSMVLLKGFTGNLTEIFGSSAIIFFSIKVTITKDFPSFWYYGFGTS